MKLLLTWFLLFLFRRFKRRAQRKWRRRHCYLFRLDKRSVGWLLLGAWACHVWKVGIRQPRNSRCWSAFTTMLYMHFVVVSSTRIARRAREVDHSFWMSNFTTAVQSFRTLHRNQTVIYSPQLIGSDQSHNRRSSDLRLVRVHLITLSQTKCSAIHSSNK